TFSSAPAGDGASSAAVWLPPQAARTRAQASGARRRDTAVLRSGARGACSEPAPAVSTWIYPGGARVYRPPPARPGPGVRNMSKRPPVTTFAATLALATPSVHAQEAGDEATWSFGG